MPSLVRRDASIYYEIAGDGPPTVLLHSFLCDGTLFKHQVAELQSSHRLVNIDLRGHGRSGEVVGPLTISDLLDDVLAVLDSEGISQAIWIGLSLGGFIALRAALCKPERVLALILMDTEAGPQSFSKKIQDIILKQALKWPGPQFLAPHIATIMLGRTTAELQPALLKQYRGQFASIRTRSMCFCIDAVMRRDDLRSRLGGVTCATLVIVGEEDKPLPPSKSRLIADAIPGAELAVIPLAGHLSAVEQPIAVNSAVRRFLAHISTMR